jgi:hypothetical protein
MVKGKRIRRVYRWSWHFCWLAVLLLVGCSRGTQDRARTTAPAGTAAISLSLKDGWTASNPYGLRVITWELEPLNLTGSEGRDTAVVVKQQYEPRLVPEKGGFRCYLDENIAGLRPGKWRISSDWGSKCDQMLKPGDNSIHFTYGVDGCVNGSVYPGD